MKKTKLFSLITLASAGLLLTACQDRGTESTNTSGTAQVTTSSNHSSSQQVAGSYQIKEQPVQGPKGQLYGQLYQPDGVENAPLVIFSHELGNTHESGQAYAEFLAGQGIATYIFDYAGGSTSSQSEGSTQDMSVLTEVSDLEAVITASKD